MEVQPTNLLASTRITISKYVILHKVKQKNQLIMYISMAKKEITEFTRINFKKFVVIAPEKRGNSFRLKLNGWNRNLRVESLHKFI